MNAIFSNPYVKTGAVLAGLWAIQHFVKDQRVKAACYGAGLTVVLKQLPVVGDVV